MTTKIFINTELFEKAFNAGRSWQIAEINEYNVGEKNMKPNFYEWFQQHKNEIFEINKEFDLKNFYYEQI